MSAVGEGGSESELEPEELVESWKGYSTYCVSLFICRVYPTFLGYVNIVKANFWGTLCPEDHYCHVINVSDLITTCHFLINCGEYFSKTNSYLHNLRHKKMIKRPVHSLVWCNFFVTRFSKKITWIFKELCLCWFSSKRKYRLISPLVIHIYFFF